MEDKEKQEITTQNQEPEKKDIRTEIRTYETDLEQALEGREGGVIKLAIEEEARKEEERKNVTLLSQKNILFGIGAIILLGLSVVAIVSVQIYTRVHPKVGTGAQRITLITFDEKKDIDIENKIPEQIKKDFETEVQTGKGENDSITYLIPIEKNIFGPTISSPSNFFKKIDISVPLQFLNGIETEYFFGVYKNKTGKNNAFVIFKAKSDEYAFAGLSEWEPTLYGDFYQLFGIIPNEETRILLEKPFEDMIIENKNTRVLLDKNDTPVFVTMFLNDGHIIFASNIETLTEITNRLYAKKN